MEIVGGIASLAGLINGVAVIAKSVSDLRERYQYAPLNISLVSSSLWAVKTALEEINDWRSSLNDKSQRSEQLDKNLSVCIESCAVLVAVIERKLGEIDLSNPSKLEKIRFVHLESIFKDFADNLGAQVRALQLLLTIFQWLAMLYLLLVKNN
jgi:hypothetical protein